MNALTVKLLRAKLTELEAAWTATDVKYLGAFEDTPVMADSFKLHNPAEHTFMYEGVCHAKLDVDYALGIIVTANQEPSS